MNLYFSSLENEEWSNPTPFPYNAKEYNVGHGFLTTTGDTLYFSSDKPGGYGEADIYVSYRKNKIWTSPQNLGPAVNTSKKDFFPTYYANSLYFASNGRQGLGGLDIYSYHFDTQRIENLGYPINSAADDFSIIYDSTLQSGYFSTNRTDYIDRIYSFTQRKAKLRVEGYLYGMYVQNEPLPRNPIWIQNSITSEIDTILTDGTGYFTFELEKDQDYKIESERKEFELIKDAKFTTNNIHKDSTLFAEVFLRPTTVIVQIRVVEKGPAGEVIPLADVTVTDYAEKTDTSLISNTEGLVTLKVERNKTYWVHGSKKGYIDGDQAFNSANALNKIIDVDLGMKPIELGEKFKLENIFYDLNKSSLREESKIALNKLALFIIKNDLTIELSAHTDSRGSSSYNQRLSQARAQSCVNYLISQGVTKSSIKARGYGEKQLVNGCKDGVQCTELEHQENRRTEVKIIGM